jgi:hypothetical protein
MPQGPKKDRFHPALGRTKEEVLDEFGRIEAPRTGFLANLINTIRGTERGVARHEALNAEINRLRRLEATGGEIEQRFPDTGERVSTAELYRPRGADERHMVGTPEERQRATGSPYRVVPRSAMKWDDLQSWREYVGGERPLSDLKFVPLDWDTDVRELR